MKITVMHFVESSDTSGYFPQLAKWHDRSRFEMHFGTLYPMDPALETTLNSYGVHCWSTGARRRVDLPLAVARLTREIRRRRVGVMHGHLFEPALVAMAAARLARVPCRVVTRHHSDYHTRANKRLHTLVDRFTTRLSTDCIAVSHHTAEIMMRLEKAPPEKIRVILNGVDADRILGTRSDSSRQIRREWADDDTFLMVQVARLHPEKGHTHLFNALPDVLRRVERPVRLLVAGEGPWRTEYEKEVQRLGVEHAVEFLGFRTDAIALMAAADLVVVPSVAEAFGLVAAEAALLEVPVVGTRAGGIPEVLGEDGILVPPGDSRALADAIVRVAHHPPTASNLASASNRMRTDFSFARMMGAYEALYTERLSNASA